MRRWKCSYISGFFFQQGQCQRAFDGLNERVIPSVYWSLLQYNSLRRKVVGKIFLRTSFRTFSKSKQSFQCSWRNFIHFGATRDTCRSRLVKLAPRCTLDFNFHLELGPSSTNTSSSTSPIPIASHSPRTAHLVNIFVRATLRQKHSRLPTTSLLWP